MELDELAGSGRQIIESCDYGPVYPDPLAVVIAANVADDVCLNGQAGLRVS